MPATSAQIAIACAIQPTSKAARNAVARRSRSKAAALYAISATTLGKPSAHAEVAADSVVGANDRIILTVYFRARCSAERPPPDGFHPHRPSESFGQDDAWPGPHHR